VPERDQQHNAGKDIGRKHLPPASLEQKMQEQGYTGGQRQNDDHPPMSVPEEQEYQTKQEAQQDPYFKETHVQSFKRLDVF
jgi:hypothetical protein